MQTVISKDLPSKLRIDPSKLSLVAGLPVLPAAQLCMRERDILAQEKDLVKIRDEDVARKIFQYRVR